MQEQCKGNEVQGIALQRTCARVFGRTSVHESHSCGIEGHVDVFLFYGLFDLFDCA